MFVEDLRADFYDKLPGNRCLLLVNYDIDAICACKILQNLFKNDNIIYTLAPVQGISDMQKAYEENYTEQLKYIIMINCGGSLDVVSLINPAPEIQIFIIDSHMPYDVCNIYNDEQVLILGKPDPDEEIPEYNDIFQDDDEQNSDDQAVSDNQQDSNDDDDDDDEEDPEVTHRAKRRRLNEDEIEKRRKQRQWEESRDTILFNYTQYSYYGKSSAVFIYELSWKLSKDNLDGVWWAIIGATEQTILNKVNSQVSVLEMGNLQQHVSRLSRKPGVEAHSQQQSAVKITFDQDLQLALYRHWTVAASLRHSMVTAVSLRLWSMRGEKRLEALFAEMGLPLHQSQQRFSAMDLTLRQEFRQMVEKLASKYQMDRVIWASFTLQYGYRFKYCASDMVYAMLALLEAPMGDRTPQSCFLDALDCLSRGNKEILERGIDQAKTMLSNIFTTAGVLLRSNKVINNGTFLYFILSNTSVDNRLFRHPHALLMLAQYTLQAYVKNSRSKGALGWPLIAAADTDTDECLLVGVPPVGEDPPRSLFGKAFEQAAADANAKLQADYFDSTIVRLTLTRRLMFFDELARLLS